MKHLILLLLSFNLAFAQDIHPIYPYNTTPDSLVEQTLYTGEVVTMDSVSYYLFVGDKYAPLITNTLVLNALNEEYELALFLYRNEQFYLHILR